MKNILIHNLNKKDAQHFTSNLGLHLRRKLDKPFKKLCNLFTNVNIIRLDHYSQDNYQYISPISYPLLPNKNNIVLERYPKLSKDESYIFVCNHTCPEDIELVLNILDRNAYLVLGSIEYLNYDPSMYLSFLNGMIPFDILNSNERKDLMGKMERVLKTNSILIFPEGSHNYHPNKIITTLYDGPINLARKMSKKIILVTLLKDNDTNVAYIDVSDPIDISKLHINIQDYYPNETSYENSRVN